MDEKLEKQKVEIMSDVKNILKNYMPANLHCAAQQFEIDSDAESGRCLSTDISLDKKKT